MLDLRLGMLESSQHNTSPCISLRLPAHALPAATPTCPSSRHQHQHDQVRLTPHHAHLWPCAGALAGNPFGVDRQAMARELGMAGVCPNSMDAVSDRDYVLETCFFAATLLTHLSRWAEDLIIYSSGAFGYVQCSDAYATGVPSETAQPYACGVW